MNFESNFRSPASMVPERLAGENIDSPEPQDEGTIGTFKIYRRAS
jgi:hypothetical protein